MRFSRDEEPDAWYTTMLNTLDALSHRTYCYSGGRHRLLALRYRAVLTFFAVCKSSTIFDLFDFFDF